ncbi:MAG: flagellar biosynthesis protein FlgA [Magnetovibrio sp.]|nr:flagellar biosynthesis protein FlgA [Magnetovibrio sp.]|tara:strand:- start:7 stop:1200 length:1194 start_codon:yes stop_codon:yes gene_type:complete
MIKKTDAFHRFPSLIKLLEITNFFSSTKKLLLILTLSLFAINIFNSSAHTASRIKDITDFEGVRDNMLVGYGLVVGLSGTGDSMKNGHFTKQSLKAMLNRLGVKPTDAGLDSKNVAAVMVTAKLPPFSRKGSRIDVTVSSLGDSSSLLGGTLLVTPILGADGEVYAVAQGQLAVGGFSAAGNAETITKGVPTSARIANGGIVEREVKFELANLKNVKMTLRNPDFTTARRIAMAINAFLGTSAATVIDTTTVQILVPRDYQGNVVNLLTDVEQLRIVPDQLARVIIDEQSGIIVMGENVRISTVAIAQGNLTIRISEAQQVSQPGPFAEVGTTQTTERTDVGVDQGADNRLAVVNESITLQEMVNGLNALGIGPRDMITILQAIKAAGAMQASIEVM